VDEYLSVEGREYDHNILRYIADAFGDQLLGVASGIDFPGYRRDLEAKFMFFGSKPHAWRDSFKAIVGKRKFWLRRWHVKNGLYGMQKVNAQMLYPETVTYTVSDRAYVCDNKVFEEGDFTVFRIFFAE
jgi:hypothetical protein